MAKIARCSVGATDCIIIAATNPPVSGGAAIAAVSLPKINIPTVKIMTIIPSIPAKVTTTVFH